MKVARESMSGYFEVAIIWFLALIFFMEIFEMHLQENV
jgi:hypothetical protein